MKRHFAASLYWFLILNFALMACAIGTPTQTLPAQTPPAAVSAPPSTSAPTASTASPTATPVPDEIVNLRALIAVKVKEGKITREQGIIEVLQNLLGEKSATNALQTNSKKVEGGSDVIRMADSYLKTGTDAKTKAEIERLLNALFPSDAALEKLSVKAKSEAPPAAHRARVLSQADREQQCQELWRLGFPDTRRPAFPCFEYAAGEVAGNRYRVFYPAAWTTRPDRTPLIERGLQLRQFTETALRDSLDAYRGLGRIGPITVIFTDLPSPLGGLASTYTRAPRDNEACPILIYAASLSLSEAHFKQTIAHESFHCFQHWNFKQQLDSVSESASDWWAEGTAEYFSNVVYPSSNFEYRYVDEFDRQSRTDSMLDMGYENFLFFQYLGNRSGNAGVLNLIRAMPTSGGKAAQRTNLSRYPNIAELYQDFAQTYLENRLVDTDGGTIPTRARLGSLREVNDAGANINLGGIEAFRIGRQLISFAANKGFAVSISPSDPRGRSAAEQWGLYGTWDRFPSTVPCSAPDRNFLLAFTTTGATDELYIVNATVAVTETPCAPTPTPAVPTCLIGKWYFSGREWAKLTADASRQYQPPGASATNMTFLGSYGDGVMYFAPDGRGQTVVNMEQRYRLATGGNVNSGVMFIYFYFSGSTNFTYQAPEANRLTMNITRNNLAASGKMRTVDGQEFPINITLPASESRVTYEYFCTGDLLQITTLLPDGKRLGPADMTRIR